MLKKLSSWFFGTIVFIGFMFMIMTIGASDLDLISLKEICIRVSIALGVMSFGAIGFKLTNV